MDPCLLSRWPDAHSCFPLLHNVAGNWERSSFFLLCCHLLTHEPTIWNRLYNTVTHFPQYAARCHRINQGQMLYTIKLHVCFCLNEFLGVYSVDFWCLTLSSNSFVGHQFGPVRCKLVAQYDNLLPWQCIENILSLYTSASCQCILAADIFCAHKRSITSGLPSKASFPSGSRCWTATAVLLLYTFLMNPTALFYINSIWNSTSPVSQIIRLVNFFDPPSNFLHMSSSECQGSVLWFSNLQTGHCISVFVLYIYL
jgi:hypothetical protein